VLEEDLERLLAHRFPTDEVTAVARGVNGADVVQKVLTNDDRICPSITWETKNTKTWQPKWIDKARADMIANGSEFAVIVTVALPKGVKHFERIEGVWVCDLTSWPALATVLRQHVISVSLARASGEGRDEKLDALYRYLTGPGFRERMNEVIAIFKAMQQELESEKLAFKRRWGTRERQIQKVLDSLPAIYGDLQGLIGKANLPEIPNLALETLDDDHRRVA
jgi:hypothetical protein